MKTTLKVLLAASALCGIMVQAPAQAGEGYWSSGYYAPTALTRADVAVIQQDLKEDGYYRARVDGHWGPRTHAAVASFQASHGLRPTGRPTVATLDTLGVNTDGSSEALAIEPAAGGTSTHESRTRLRDFFNNGPGVVSVDTNHENGSTCLTCTNGIVGNGGTSSMQSNEY